MLVGDHAGGRDSIGLMPPERRVSGAGRTADPMADTTYLVRFKGADPPPELVIAETIDLHGEHLVFLRSDGSLAALFVLEIVESWYEVKC
jgi:hypothetical protein